MPLTVIPLIRQGVLGVTSVFSLIVLAISAHLVSQPLYYGATASFGALGIAVALISLVTLPVMLVVDNNRPGAFTSMIVVEVVWLSILWILWVATAGETVNVYGAACVYVFAYFPAMCQETQAIEAFSFLNFVIILLYTGFLSGMTVIASNRGQSVWLSSVKESFGSPADPVEHPMTKYDASVPPQPYPQYPAGPTQPGATVGGPAIRV